MAYRARRAGLVLAFLLMAGRACLGGIEVVEVRWGFDGRVVPGRINLMNVCLVNQGETPVELQVSLYRTNTVLQQGGTLVGAGYLVPNLPRWFAFYPYVSERREEWHLDWDGGGRTLPAPRFGPPARVFLDSRRGLAARPAMKVFPAELFPPTVSVTDGLHSVVLDHVPERWEPARRRAFLDWVRRGGVLHVLHDAEGRFPRFSGDLDALSSEARRSAVGAGQVVHHGVTRHEFGPLVLSQAGFPAPTLVENDDGRIVRVEDIFFQRLAQLTVPRHNWALIYSLTVVYLVVVGPVCLVLGRRRVDYRVVHLAFLGVVGLFAVVFYIVGERGYGEVSRVHTLAYARSVGGDRWDTASWTSAFVTSGGIYRLSHGKAAAAYSTCEYDEAVNAKVGRFGGTVSLLADMPAYSTRTFQRRGCVRGVDPGLAVVEGRAESDGALSVWRAHHALPDGALKKAWLFHEGGFYPLAVRGALLELGDGERRVALEELLTEERVGANGFMGNIYVPDAVGNELGAAEVFASLVYPALAYGLGGTGDFCYQTAGGLPGDGAADLFLYGALPAAFCLPEGPLGPERGRVLYHLRVPVRTPVRHGPTDGEKEGT